MTDSDLAILLAVVDDAEPLAIVVNSVDLSAEDRGISAIRTVVSRCRLLEARGIVRLRWLEDGQFRDPSLPITANEYEAIPDLHPDGSARSVSGLSIELTPIGRNLVISRFGGTSSERLWRVEEYPEQRRLVVYAATEDLADQVAREFVTAAARSIIEGAVRNVDQGVRFTLASGTDIPLGVRVTYQGSQAKEKH